MKVELNVPKPYEKSVKLTSREWKDSFKYAFLEALEKSVKQKAAFKSLKNLSRKSKLTDKQAMQLGKELKKRVAKRHGLL